MLQKQNARRSKEKKLDPYGPERSYWMYALRLAWQDFYHLSQQQILDKKRVQHFKRLIRKLQANLRNPITEFTIYEAIAWGFYNLNPELFKEDVNEDLVEKAIIKTTAILGSRMRFDLKPNMAVDLMKRDKALGAKVPNQLFRT
jgi:hypothetical protein